MWAGWHWQKFLRASVKGADGKSICDKKRPRAPFEHNCCRRHWQGPEMGEMAVAVPGQASYLRTLVSALFFFFFQSNCLNCT